MAINNALDYSKFPAAVDAAITALRADEVARLTAENARLAALVPPGTPIVIETNADYAQRVLVTEPVKDWLRQNNENQAAKGKKRAIIDALRAGTLTQAQVDAMAAAGGL